MPQRLCAFEKRECQLRVLVDTVAAMVEIAQTNQRRSVVRIEFQRARIVLTGRDGQTVRVVAVAPQIVGT
jgi:hypothetical protein